MVAADKQLTKNVLKYFRDTPDTISYHPNWEGDKSFIGQNNGKGIVKSPDGVIQVQVKSPNANDQSDYFSIKGNVLKYFNKNANANFIVSHGSKVIVEYLN